MKCCEYGPWIVNYSKKAQKIATGTKDRVKTHIKLY
jgi:hypothetical protein